MNQCAGVPGAQMAGATDPGRVRPTNQDNFLVADLRRLMQICDSSVLDFDGKSVVAGLTGELLAVADGMGGYRHGEVASQTAIRQLANYISNLRVDFLAVDQHDDAAFRAALAELPDRIHRLLQRDGQRNPQKSQMGTTLTAAYVIWPMCYVLHVGDSRCYLLRDGILKQLTRDHTVAQSMMDSGMPEEELNNPAFHHMLWNSIAASDHAPQPDLSCEQLQPGDSLLLCSDGLTRHLGPAEMTVELQSLRAPVDKCRRLIDMANHRGGRDNITVVIAEFASSPEADDVCESHGSVRRRLQLADTAEM